MGHTFSERLKSTRIERGFTTQSEFAKALGLTTQTINYYEQGKRKPDYEVFGRIADTLDVSCEYLLGKTECKKPEYQLDFERLGLTLESQMQLTIYKVNKEKEKKKRIYTIDIVNYLLNGFSHEKGQGPFSEYECHILEYLEGYLRSCRLGIEERFFYTTDKKVITQKEYMLLEKEQRAVFKEIPISDAMKAKYYEYLVDSIKDTWQKLAEYELFEDEDFAGEDDEFYNEIRSLRGLDGYNDD